ncbi:hypothetical protein ERX46_03450 [Brumimicrobium glaciale]|uniref:DUF3108 domain-containing protein n=1 Tax=Brumimicrobium glaciale TaxID=200475 RepID=A0A4Q4KVE7_9FLAO|nr:hypothetical protein [Brumimicrobium glaciale]RYM36064.1 hypothetical protein ERX46_03450 [Brumimicrobium glaciale]
MKNFITTLFLSLFTTVLFSQECMNSEYLKKGTQWEITSFDKKGKNTGFTKHEILNASHSSNKSLWEIKTQLYDEKDEFIHDGTIEVICENGIYKIDMSQMIPAETMKSLESMEVEMDGTSINYPTEKDVNTQLEDATITISASTSGISIMNMKITTFDRKIEGIETVKTDAGNFECLKITEKAKMENSMMSRESSTISWFLTGFGVVKSESYNHKDKLTGSSELSALSYK